MVVLIVCTGLKNNKTIKIVFKQSRKTVKHPSDNARPGPFYIYILAKIAQKPFYLLISRLPDGVILTVWKTSAKGSYKLLIFTMISRKTVLYQTLSVDTHL